MACRDVPRWILGASARLSMLRAARWAGCGRLLAVAAMQGDYMGALALGRQQKVARNGPIGAHLEREVEDRELVQHVDVRRDARSSSPSTRRLERRVEASKSCRPKILLLHHELRGASQRFSAGKLRTKFQPARARPSATGGNGAGEGPKQDCARGNACDRAHCSAQAHAPACLLAFLATRQVMPPSPMGVESPYFSAMGACNTYTGQRMPLASISGAYTRHVYRF